MSNKLSEEELNNVSGGCGSGNKCAICGSKFEDSYWSCYHLTNLHKNTWDKIKTCDACAKAHKNDPHYKKWEKHTI